MHNTVARGLNKNRVYGVNLSELSHNQLRRLIRLASLEKKQRYPRNRETRYGNIARALSQEQLERFLANVENEKAHLAFTCMAYLGLRVGECVRMRLNQIDFVNAMLFVETEKAGTNDAVPICAPLMLRLRAWCNLPGVRETGYVFWSANPAYDHLHITAHWLQKEFRIAARKAELNSAYAASNERHATHRGRQLYQFTTHSLRHTFGRSIRRMTKDLEVTRALMRHKSLKSTQIYAKAGEEELRTAIVQTFGGAQ